MALVQLDYERLQAEDVRGVTVNTLNHLWRSCHNRIFHVSGTSESIRQARQDIDVVNAEFSRRYAAGMSTVVV